MTLDLSSIPIVDHHAHALLRVPPSGRDAWHSFFTESSDPEIVRDHVPHLLFFRWAVKALAGLLRCSATPEAVLAERDRRGVDAWAELMVRDANIGMMLLDLGFRGDLSYGLDEMRELLPCRIEPILRLETLAQDLIVKYDSYDEVLEAFLAEVEGARAAGYVALKSIIAYRTGLNVSEWDGDAVLAAFRPLKEQARREGAVRLASRPLTDTLLRAALEIAERQEMPVQFHTGFGDSDVDLLLANPLHFRPLLESHRFRHVPWIILHQGYPYTRQSAYLANIYSNVYVDLSLAIPFAVAEGPQLITELLGLAPLSKLMYASDGFSVPELFWLGARAGRAAISSALAVQVAGDLLTVDEALQAAAMILHRNAQRVYRL